jgi:hypothetical protein
MQVLYSHSVPGVSSLWQSVGKELSYDTERSHGLWQKQARHLFITIPANISISIVFAFTSTQL